MMKPSKLAIVFNGAAILIGLASVGAVLKSFISPDEVPPCSTRYEHGTQYPLERSGAPMTAADLQARMSGTDWGVLDNATVEQRKDSPSGNALKVRLAKLSPESAPAPEGRRGMGFLWSPKMIGQAEAACLSYSVFLPENFEFGKGGRLPGLMGAGDGGPASETQFSTRYFWRDNGGLEIYGQMPGWPEARWLTNERRGFLFPRGKWVSLEQEVVLNAPGEKNGLLRVWADGALKFENSTLKLRDKPEVKITGVLAEASGDASSQGGAAGKDQQLWLSTPELRWH